MNQCISLSLSNSSQLYQIKGQPLTIAHPTTTLSNPSATIGANAVEPTDEADYEGDEEEEGEASSGAESLRVGRLAGLVVVFGCVAGLGVTL